MLKHVKSSVRGKKCSLEVKLGLNEFTEEHFAEKVSELDFAAITFGPCFTVVGWLAKKWILCCKNSRRLFTIMWIFRPIDDSNSQWAVDVANFALWNAHFADTWRHYLATRIFNVAFHWSRLDHVPHRPYLFLFWELKR